MTEEKPRTQQQNRALHLYFGLIAKALNEAGLDMKKVLKPGVEIPWSAQSVKDFMWVPIQKAQLRKEHTHELNSTEIDVIYDTLNRHLSEKFGISEPFPSIAEIINKQRNVYEASNSKRHQRRRNLQHQ